MKKASLWALGTALGLVLVGLCFGSAWAEEEPQQAILSTVVVTATKTERELVQVPASISVVDSDMMKAQPKATLAEMLQDISSVEVKDQGVPGLKKVTIRGDSASRILVLIDGQKVGSQKSMDGIPLMIDPNNVERIEVIKGPASVLYGSEAVGGVVNIITKKGGERPVQADLSGTYNSAFNGLTSGVSLYGSLNRFDYRLSASYTDADDLEAPSGTIEDTSFMNRDLDGYLGYNWDDGSLGLKAESFWSNSNSPRLSISETGWIDLDLPTWKRDKVGLFFEHKDITPWFAGIKANAFYQQAFKDFYNVVDPTGSGRRGQIRVHTENDESSIGGDLQLDWTPTNTVYLVTGVSYLREDIKAHSKQNDDPIESNKGYQDNFSLFTQAEWSMTNDWILTLGLRQTFISTWLVETSNPKLDAGTTSSSHPVGSIGLVYSGITDWTFRALLAQGYRSPNIQQLFLGNHHGRETLPNPDLKEETSNNLELGARYNNGNLKLDTTLFMSKAKDYITENNEYAPGKWQFANADEATTYGGELEISYLFEELNLTPYASGAYTRRQFDFQNANGTSEKTWNTGAPELAGRVGIRYERECSNNITFTSDLYGRFASKTKNEFTKVFGDKEKPGWGTCNLALGLLYGEEKDYRLSVNLNNLFDKEYKEAASDITSPGFHAIVRLDVSF